MITDSPPIVTSKDSDMELVALARSILNNELEGLGGWAVWIVIYYVILFSNGFRNNQLDES